MPVELRGLCSGPLMCNGRVANVYPVAFPPFEPHSAWHHFAFETTPELVDALIDALRVYASTMDLAPLARFDFVQSSKRERERSLATVVVPTRQYEETVARIRALLASWDAPLALPPLGTAVVEGRLVSRQRFQFVRARLEMSELARSFVKEPIDRENPRVMIEGIQLAHLLEGWGIEGDVDLGPYLGVGHARPDREPVEFAPEEMPHEALEQSPSELVENALRDIALPFPVNEGLGGAYALTDPVARQLRDGNAWSFPPLDLPETPFDASFNFHDDYLRTYDRHPPSSDRVGPFRFAAREGLRRFAAELERGYAREVPEACPPHWLALDAQAIDEGEESISYAALHALLRERLAMFARACRRIADAGGAMVSFVGKNPRF
jgi:hypothetical protein